MMTGVTMNTENGVATFRTENRYAAMYPDIRAVAQPTLHVIKRLRAAGIPVRIEPSDQRPLCFTFQRGIGDWLADPSLVLLASIPVNIVSNILYVWWHDRKKCDREFPSAAIAFVVEEDGDIRYYSLDGQLLRREVAHEISSRAQRSAEVFLRAINTPAPDPRRRYPIQRDHSGDVVRWFGGLKHNTNTGSLDLLDPIVTDPATKADLTSGKLAGMSVGAIAQRSLCSICRGDYVECNHVAGDEYENRHCVVFIEESLPAEFSVVQDPINPDTKFIR
jgi:hypothetical protein